MILGVARCAGSSPGSPVCRLLAAPTQNSGRCVHYTGGSSDPESYRWLRCRMRDSTAIPVRKSGKKHLPRGARGALHGEPRYMLPKPPMPIRLRSWKLSPDSGRNPRCPMSWKNCVASPYSSAARGTGRRSQQHGPAEHGARENRGAEHAESVIIRSLLLLLPCDPVVKLEFEGRGGFMISTALAIQKSVFT